MRSLKKICLAAHTVFILIILLCGCNELALEHRGDEARSVILTKTSMDGEQIKWSEGDRISVTYTHDDNWKNQLSVSEPLLEDCVDAEFKLVLDMPVTFRGPVTFYALYPSSCVLQGSESLPSVTVEIPCEQQSSSSSFDKSADLMVAKSEESYDKLPGGQLNLVWKRAVAHADITIDGLQLDEDETISLVVLTAGEGESLAGEYLLDIRTGALEPSFASGSLTLNLPLDYSGNQGKYRMWASVAPSKVSTLEIKVQTSKAIYRREITDCNLEFEANMRTVMTLDMSDAEVIPLDEAEMVIRDVHPRLFLTSADIPLIKENALGRENELYSQMKKRVDRLMESGITFPDPLAATGEDNSNHEVGTRAAEAALVWLVGGDKTYLEATKTILNALIGYYQLRVENNLNIDWYIFSQVCALCAYDWIYTDLTDDERQSIGKNLFEVMYDIAWHGDGLRQERYRENTSEPSSGCYGVSALPWYISIAFWGDGFDDEKCASMFAAGYDFHNRMVAHRKMMAGDNGGGATPCLEYAVGSYPISDFNFLRTYRSATGMDLAPMMDYVLKYLDYIDWNSLPAGSEGVAREFGFGDTFHGLYQLPYGHINYHLYEIADIFGSSSPETLPRVAGLLSRFSLRREVDLYPFMRLLQKEHPEANPEFVNASHKVKYFDTVGQVIMRSGNGGSDTYAMFVSGGISTTHKHYDNNHFIIYNHGYRALDSGTRPQPGQHLSHYYARTVAHNCITVRMPGETFPNYWGSAAEGEEVLPVPNDGGQRKLLASQLRVLKETDDYVYLASDATDAYDSKKASLVMREFVWCVPDVFVIFDRVSSTDASYPKTWLYHTAAEPVIRGNEFCETSQGGKSLCRTILPADAVLEKIGGPGYQFWSDGRNWPLTSVMPGNVPNEEWPLLGQWRMEVKPGAERKEDVFMHIVQVGDESLTSLPATETFETASETGVSFTYGGKSWCIAFDRMADFGCDITIN